MSSITFRTRADIKNDRQVVLTLPPEVPTGQAELLVTIEPAAETQPSTADWLEVETGRDSSGESPLRGSVVRYDRPTEPVAQDDWEAME